jgi:hypothetical protein
VSRACGWPFEAREEALLNPGACPTALPCRLPCRSTSPAPSPKPVPAAPVLSFGMVPGQGGLIMEWGLGQQGAWGRASRECRASRGGGAPCRRRGCGGASGAGIGPGPVTTPHCSLRPFSRTKGRCVRTGILPASRSAAITRMPLLMAHGRSGAARGAAARALRAAACWHVGCLASV